MWGGRSIAAAIHNRRVNARFYAPDARAPGDLITLPEDEGEHLTRVLRLKTGDMLRVFNGHGGEFDAIVDEAARRGVRVRVVAAAQPAPEPRVAITLAQAVLKADKMDAVLRDATRHCVPHTQPPSTARSEGARGALARGERKRR